jgi:hypothetical protein
MTVLKMDFVLRVNSNTGRVLSVLDSSIDSEKYEDKHDLAVDTVRVASVEVDIDELRVTEGEFGDMTEAERRPYVFEAALSKILPMGDDSR